MISRRTLKWFAAFLLLAGGIALRVHWEISTCKEFVQQHAYHGSGDVVSNQTDVVKFSVDDLCQPGELEPWWAKVLILGAFVAFIGTIIEFIMDVRIWFRRVRI